MSIIKYIQNLFGSPQPEPTIHCSYTYQTITLHRKIPNARKLWICKLLVDRLNRRDYYGNAWKGDLYNSPLKHSKAMRQQDKDYLAHLMGKHIDQWWKG